MDNPFTWDRLTTPPGPDEVFNPASIAYLVLFGLGFLASLLLSNDAARRVVDQPIKRRALRRAGGIGTGVFGAGLFFFGIRLLQINPFGFAMPIWLWLCLIALIVAVVYLVRYARTAYPAQLRAYEQHKVKQRYLKPATSSRTAPARAARPVRRRR